MTGGLGGGVIFVVAALLWIAVLVPAWVRRREFRAAERNALRLQRTLRVLAETSEVPQEVRLEATAKQALAHEKLLRTAQRRQEAERDAELAEARAEQVRAEIRAQQIRRKQAAVHRSARLRRPLVRRVRGIAFLGTVVGLLGALVGTGLAIAGSGTAMLVWSAALFAAALGGLVLLAPGRARMHSIPAERIADAPTAQVHAPEADQPLGETDESAAAHQAAQRAAADRIARARALARARAEAPGASSRVNQPDSMLLRESGADRSAGAGAGASAGASARAAASPERPAAAAAAQTPDPVAATTPAAPRKAPQSRVDAERIAARQRLSQMGRVGDTTDGMPDLDAVLRRRRNVG
ncbi:hypothetical protein MUN76_13210 [Leucobacter rhizosphaerae]|uniref:Large exoprotein n=1 Tax=Leucobacter rhizosphaerae TaxID=2932245 RepID=A0ABY4FUK4_9MICO|nr:hypothetical protein [Leucobacter rhizosphaerae]UOQ59989.1 hypothetical protein MUN76_13210 [Leucobacter rhizosphaerae]